MAAQQANIRTFRAPLRGPGRLAPTLIEDLTLYDPHWDSAPGRNLLNDPPINFGNTDFLHQILLSSSCRHAFYIQPRRTKSPLLDERPTSTSLYHVTALCRLCAIHLTLKVDYTRNWAGGVCPNQDRPVHHLVQSSYNQQLARSNWSRQTPRSSDEIYVYECTSPTCGVQVTVTLSPGVLRPDEIHTLTDAGLLRQRTDAAFEARKGETEGMKRPSPTDVLVDLRAYIRNSWRKDAKRDIALDNKRFAVRFGPNGDACREVLENLGFKYKPEECWQAPCINPEDTSPLQDPVNIFLDNLEHELSALILRRPSEERSASQDTTTLEDAGKEFARALSCQAYDQIPAARTSSSTPGDRRFFIVLGAPENASDNLVKFAYDSQCVSCPEYSPTFLSALRDIALARESENLNICVAVEVSRGKIDAEQLSAAYRALGVPMTTKDDGGEAHIIGTFNARLTDSPSQEAELRECLRTIGIGLNSKRVTDYASREISTYEQALDFLSATTDTTDEWVQSLYSVKLTESPSHKDLATKAVRVIAECRQSRTLKAWIDSGFSTDTAGDMDLGAAYQALDIADRTMDDSTLLTVYEIRKQEDPSNVDCFTKALSAIARDRDSTMLLSELQLAGPDRPPMSMLEPVGLDNIGNTCYLNSLLQSFFTIRVVREIVLSFDDYKMDPTEENMATKKVGQRQLSIKEVETAHKFVRNLATLFDSMITTPHPAVRPAQELARLTLETDAERLRRRSTLAGGTRPNLGSIDSGMIQGPLLPPLVQASGDIEETRPLLTSEVLTTTPDDEQSRELGAGFTQLSQFQGDDDNSSELTLVSRPSSVDHMDLEAATVEQQRMILDNKENLSPVKVDEIREPLPLVEPLRPASPSKINIQAGALLRGVDQEGSDLVQQPQQETEKNVTIYEPPPGRPPPFPPRKPVDTVMPTLEEYAKQQDVTEVFNHCVLQLSYAIKPTGFESSGEQKDEVHDLFFGDVETHAMLAEEQKAPEAFLNIMVRINNLPRDIYAALDNNYDLSTSGKIQFQSISRPPPILTIALGRVVWDTVKASNIKLEHFVEMPEIMYLDRYLETSPQSQLMQARQRSWRLKARLASLNEDKARLEKEHASAKDVPSLFDDAKRALLFLRDVVQQDEKYGGPITFDPSLPDKLAELAGKSRTLLHNITLEIDKINGELATMFDDFKEHQYRLHAIFFHRGGHGSGHYWIYIRDHQSGVWRKYNDDHVTVVQNTKEIFGQPETNGGWSGPANAYFLIYVKSDEATGGIEQYVETVKRAPIELPNPESYLEPLGGFDYRPSGPSQMSEMPPGRGYGLESTAAWASEVTASQVEPGREWDDSEASQDPAKWYR